MGMGVHCKTWGITSGNIKCHMFSCSAHFKGAVKPVLRAIAMTIRHGHKPGQRLVGCIVIAGNWFSISGDLEAMENLVWDWYRNCLDGWLPALKPHLAQVTLISCKSFQPATRVRISRPQGEVPVESHGKLQSYKCLATLRTLQIIC